MIRAVEVGRVARAALERSGGVAEPLAAHGPFFLRAAGEIVWLGPPGAILHPRTVVAAGDLPARPARVIVDVTGARTWDPPPAVVASAQAYIAACGDLLATLGGLRSARGLATLVWPSSEPADALAVSMRTCARPAVVALAAACDADDATAATAAATRLLGLGPGLTPAGDDLVGGVLFARAVLGPSGAADAAAWRAAGAALLTAAGTRTHPVSAALLADMAAGRGYAPLLDLVEALARRHGEPALHAASRLVAIGHSSGWDTVAGFMVGTLGGRALA